MTAETRPLGGYCTFDAHETLPVLCRTCSQRGVHQGAWNLMKAFLPKSKTSVSKLESVSVTDPAAAEPTTAAQTRSKEQHILMTL